MGIKWCYITQSCMDASHLHVSDVLKHAVVSVMYCHYGYLPSLLISIKGSLCTSERKGLKCILLVTMGRCSNPKYGNVKISPPLIGENLYYANFYIHDCIELMVFYRIGKNLFHQISTLPLREWGLAEVLFSKSFR